jgi:3-oxoadipate enol-lactonase
VRRRGTPTPPWSRAGWAGPAGATTLFRERLTAAALAGTLLLLSAVAFLALAETRVAPLDGPGVPSAGSPGRVSGILAVMELMVSVNGGEVRAEDRGSGDPAVLLLHPGWGDSSIWDGVLDRLPEGARVVRYDSRGYGRSPAPATEYTELGDLEAVLERLDVSDAVVAGHSGGGATALGLALAHPDRVRSLVLIAPGVSDYPWPEHEPFYAGFGPLYEAGDREGLVTLGLKTWAAAGHDAAAEAQIRAAVGAFFAQGDFLRPDPPALGRLHEITVRTDVMVGDLDDPGVIDCARAVAAGIPGSRLLTVAGADHLLPLRDPALVARIISGHLTGRS